MKQQTFATVKGFEKHSGKTRKEAFLLRMYFLANCRIPDDSIQYSRWPLFFAREVLREVVDSLKTRKGEEDGTSFA